MWRRRLALAVLSACALAACGGPAATTTTTAPAARFTYGPSPSVSARMICRHETIAAVASESVGERTTTPPTSTWARHRYTCTFHYGTATMVLWVQELPSLPATSAYTRALATRLGDAQRIANVGQGSFATRDGSTVSRKDNKVLVVDVAGLPATFGSPPVTRADIALSVTQLIFACWRGD